MSEPYRVAIRDLLLTRGEVKVRELEKFDLAAMTRMLLDHSKMLQAITNNRDIPLQSEVIRQADALVGDIQLMHMKTLYQLQKSERHSALLQL